MATYYWVGGSGTWDNADNTNWATSTGGAGGNGPPTATDTVNFDTNSGTAAVVTVAATAVSLNTTVNKSDINLSLSGSPTLCTTVGTLTLTSGTITLNDFILTVGFWSSSNTNARSIAFGTSGELRVNGSNTLVYFASDLTNFTYTGTSKVNLTYAGSTGTRVVRHGNTAGGSETTAFNFYFSAGTDIVTFTGAPYIKTLDFTGFAGTWTNVGSLLYGNLIVSSGMTVGAGTGILNLAATSGTQQITTNNKTLDFPITFLGVGGTFQLQDDCTIGSTRTVTLTNGTLDLNNLTLSTGNFNSSNSNIRSIAFNTGNITLTGNSATVWTTSTVTNFAYTGTPEINLTYAGSTGTRAITTGASSLAQAVNFNVTGGSDTINFTSTNSVLQNLIFSGFTGTLTNTNKYVTGNVTFSSGMTLNAGANSLIFYSTASTQNLTSNGLTLDFPITIGASTQAPVVIFQDALTQGSTRAFTLTNGTVQFKAGIASTVGAFATSGTTRKYLQSDSLGTQATLSQASGTANVQYVNAQDIAATGGAVWNLVNGSVNNGNLSGWYVAHQQNVCFPNSVF